MNDLMRPSMYQSFHGMTKVIEHDASTAKSHYDIVGPVCETGDWLGKNRKLDLHEGDLIAILSAGAYGMSMASNYNSRPRAAEVLVDNGRSKLIRRRETLNDLLGPERI
jgi:diaminopimelate decarboxylase